MAAMQHSLTNYVALMQRMTFLRFRGSLDLPSQSNILQPLSVRRTQIVSSSKKLFDFGLDYEADTGFLDKNRDFLVPAHPLILKESTHPFIRQLATFCKSGAVEPSGESGGSRIIVAPTRSGSSSFKFVGIASQFKVRYTSPLPIHAIVDEIIFILPGIANKVDGEHQPDWTSLCAMH